MTLTRVRTTVIAVLALAALLLLGAQAALSAPSLPPITPDELLASTLERAVDPPAMSGELAATLGLGLPVAPDEDSALSDLLGESRLRVERSEDGLRAALLGRRSERLVVTDGATLTTWDSRTLEATQRALAPSDRPGAARELPDGLEPLAVATRILALAGAHADVAVDGTARVAGRPAYRLVLTPTHPGTTLGRVEVDIDADERVPLRTALFARGAQAASIEVAWTRVSFAPIDPATFTFTPPPGATVSEAPAHSGDHTHGEDGPSPLAALEAIAAATGGVGPIAGEGFASVAVLPLPSGGPASSAPEGAPRMDALLPLDGPLLSVRLAEVGGRRVVLAGFVPLSRLDEIAATLPAATP